MNNYKVLYLIISHNEGLVKYNQTKREQLYMEGDLAIYLDHMLFRLMRRCSEYQDLF